MININSLDRFEPTIFIYDNYPGGIGFSEILFENHALLLEQAFDRVLSCECDLGCPACVGPVNEVGAGTKEIAMEIFRNITDKTKVMIQ